jgi:hypothetical protein
VIAELLQARREQIRLIFLIALTALPFLIGIAFVSLRPDIVHDPDSITYQNWSPIRTSGYAIFLDIADGPYLLHIQVFLLSAAAAWLGFYVYRLFGSLSMAWLIVIGLVGNPFLWLLQGSILSEALSTPFLLVFTGCLLGFTASRRTAWILTASVVAGIIATIRPAGLPLIAAPVLAVLLVGSYTLSSRLKLLALCVCLWLVPVASDRLYSRAVHGEKLTSLAGRHMFAKAALIDAPSVDTTGFTPLELKLAALAEVGYQPVRRELERLNGSSVHDVLRPNYEVCIQYACTNGAISFLQLPEHELNEGLLNVGLARLKQNPLGFLRLAWDEYLGLWVFHSRRHPLLADDFNRYVAQAGPLPFQRELGPDVLMVPEADQNPLFRVTRPFFIILGSSVALIMIAFGWLILVHRKRCALLLAAFICATTVEAVLVFNALTGIGIPRYTMGLWPLIVCAAFIGALSMLRWLGSFSRHEAAAPSSPSPRP